MVDALFSWFRLCTTMHGFIAVQRSASLVARLLR
jgi:hypothetical protein